MRSVMNKLYQIIYISNPETDLLKLRNTFTVSLSIIAVSSIALLLIESNRLYNQQLITKDLFLYLKISFIALLIMSILTVFLILNSVLREYYRFKSLIDEETPFLILLASTSPYSGYEIEHLIRKISFDKSNYVFGGYRRIAYKIINLAQYTSIAESMKMISSLIPVKKFSKLVKDYLYNKVHGSQREYLSLLSEEMIRELNNSVKRESSLKTNIQAISLVIMTLTPIIISSISRIQGSALPLETDLFIILSSVFLLAITPRNPLVLRLVNKERILYLRDGIVAIITVITIFSLLVRHYMILKLENIVYNSIDFVTYLIITNFSLISVYTLSNTLILMIIIGLLGTHQLFEYIYSLNELSKAKEILIQSLSHLRIFKELGGFDIGRYIDPSKKPRSWLLNYIIFSINYMKDIGVVIEELYEKFVDRTLEILSIYKNYIFQSILYVIILLLQPYIFTRTEYMLQNALGAQELFLISTIMSSMITSKIIFGFPYNGLVISSTILLYNSLMR
ncbi:MAG: hypothetical protein ACP5GI_03000 [Sulfolobales archaeon]